MDNLKWRANALMVIGYAQGAIESTSYQVSGDLKDKLISASSYIKNETDKLMDEIKNDNEIVT